MTNHKSQVAETPNEDPRDDGQREQYEAEWEQLDGKVLLAQILAELQQIRMTLQNAESADESETMYRCGKCRAEVPADTRERHAREAHNAPASIADELFTEV